MFVFSIVPYLVKRTTYIFYCWIVVGRNISIGKGHITTSTLASNDIWIEASPSYCIRLSSCCLPHIHISRLTFFFSYNLRMFSVSSFIYSNDEWFCLCLRVCFVCHIFVAMPYILLFSSVLWNLSECKTNAYKKKPEET